jgi:superfamily I DNA/RNA helicase
VCAAHTREPDQAQVFLSTAHKAKGREFEQVELSDGFIDLNNPRKDERGQPLPFDPQEVNLLYVAVTRAQRALHLPVELRGWLLAQDWDTEKLAALGSETSVLRAAA